jgi:hypothetical protein
LHYGLGGEVKGASGGVDPWANCGGARAVEGGGAGEDVADLGAGAVRSRPVFAMVVVVVVVVVVVEVVLVVLLGVLEPHPARRMRARAAKSLVWSVIVRVSESCDARVDGDGLILTTTGRTLLRRAMLEVTACQPASLT